jgi:hypothetical protein
MLPRQDHLSLESVARADDRWRFGYVELVHGSHVVIGYLDQSRAVLRLCEPALAPIAGLVEVHELIRFLLVAGRVYRIEVIASNSPSGPPPPAPQTLVPMIRSEDR